MIQTGSGNLNLHSDNKTPTTLKNEAGASYLIESDSGIDNLDGTTAVVNLGLIRKTAGNGLSTLFVNGAFSNSGTVEADSGTLFVDTPSVSQIAGNTLTGGTWEALDGFDPGTDFHGGHHQPGESGYRWLRSSYPGPRKFDDQLRHLDLNQWGQPHDRQLVHQCRFAHRGAGASRQHTECRRQLHANQRRHAQLPDRRHARQRRFRPISCQRHCRAGRRRGYHQRQQLRTDARTELQRHELHQRQRAPLRPR